MGTWHNGSTASFSHVPFRVRVRCARRRFEGGSYRDSGHSGFYTLVSYVDVPSFKGLSNVTLLDDG